MIKLPKIKLSKHLILLFIAIVGIIITGTVVLLSQLPSDKNTPESLSVEEMNEIAQKAISYINTNLLGGGTTASLVESLTENGLIKIRLIVEGNEIDSYISLDGKLLFLQAFDLSDELIAEDPGLGDGTSDGVDIESCEEITKVEKPLLEAFVVSKCPYGVQMQRILAEVVRNIPSLAENMKVRYMGSISGGKITAMHGDQEAQENLRQICLREETEKYWDYIACHIKKGDVEDCLSNAQVNVSQLNSCMTDSSKGLEYAKEDFDLQTEHDVKGSPTLILTGEGVSEFGFGGRTAEALKTLICCGFTNTPDVCSQVLDENRAATSFSEVYSSGNAPSDGGCE